MKKGYRRLLLFEFLLAVLLVLNSFVSSILSKYNLVLCLGILLIIFKFFFGFEKDRHRYMKDLLLEVSIFLIVFFLWYYIFGLVIHFVKVDSYFNYYGITRVLLPLTLTIILKEIFRYMVLTKSEGSKVLIVTTCILFILLDITNGIYYGNFETNYDKFLFIALTLLPAISSNIACTYVSIKTGYKPILLYLLVINLYKYLMPIIPNPDEYIYSIVMLILPILFAYRVFKFFEKERDKDVDREYNKKSFMPLVMPLVLVVFCVYFVSGYFHYHAIAVASGSMTPKIRKGDVVIVEKIDGKYDTVQEGQVIAFRHDNIMVVHRVIKIVKAGDDYFFYTKGDANAEEDGYPIMQEDVYGTVNLKVSYIGIPTVWLNELL